MMDQYILTTPENFSRDLSKIEGTFDAVVSSHNFEHVNDRHAVLTAMIDKLAPNGQIFLSFPCSLSVTFPNRLGTLNYYDDPTHTGVPPDAGAILKMLEEHALKVTYLKSRYRPLLWYVFGMLVEPISAIQGKVLRGTWEYYGFETTISVRKQ